MQSKRALKRTSMEVDLSTPIVMPSPGLGSTSSSDSTSPALPPEVLSIIFGKLKKKELLNCRLVSKSWNDWSMDKMVKLEHMQRLYMPEVKKYVRFLNRTGAEIPLPLNLVVDHSHRDPGFPNGSIDIGRVKADMDSLLELAGVDSIAEVEFRDLDRTNVKGIHSVLEKVSHGLKSVYLLSPPICTLGDGEAENTSSQENMKITFPKLKKIVGCVRNKAELEAHNIFCEMGPPLQVVNIIGSLRIESTELKIPLQHLKSLSLLNFRQYAILQDQIRASPWTPRLEKFKFNTGPSEWGDRQEEQENQRILSALLKEFSATLVYLSCYIPPPDNSCFTVPFPILSVLEKLKFRLATGFEHAVEMTPIQMVSMNFTPEFLPSLKQVDVPLGFLCSPDIWDTPVSNNLVFGTVSSIVLRVCVFDDEEDDINWGLSGSVDYSDLDESPTAKLTDGNVKDFLDYIFHMFPNSTRVCVKGSGEYVHDYMRRVILALLKATYASKIQELEVCNYQEDYIGSVLHGLDNPPEIQITMSNFPSTSAIIAGEAVKKLFGKLHSGLTIGNLDIKQTFQTDGPHTVIAVDKDFKQHNLTNIRKVRLVSRCVHKCHNTSFTLQTDFKASKAKKRKSSDNEQILHLEALVRHLPSLDTVEMSANMLAGGNQVNLKRVRKLENKYPNLRIFLI